MTDTQFQLPNDEMSISYRARSRRTVKAVVPILLGVVLLNGAFFASIPLRILDGRIAGFAVLGSTIAGMVAIAIWGFWSGDSLCCPRCGVRYPFLKYGLGWDRAKAQFRGENVLVPPLKACRKCGWPSPFVSQPVSREGREELSSNHK